MEKFTKIEKQKDKIETKEEPIFQNSLLKIKKLNDSVYIEEKDQIVCIPYLTEQNQIIVRQEENAVYESIDGQQLHISPLSTSVSDEYDMKWELMKMLETKVGIVIRDKYPFEFEAPLFESKNSTKRIFFSILPLSESDYHQVLLSDDLHKDKQKLIKIDAKYIRNLHPSDIITEMALNKVKKFLNIG